MGRKAEGAAGCVGGLDGGGLDGVQGVFDEGGPDLVELGTVGADGLEGGVEVDLDGDARRRELNMARVFSRLWAMSTSCMGAWSM